MTMNLRTLCLLPGLLLAVFARADENDYREPFNRAGGFHADGRVTLENVNGSVTIETWDRNEIRIEGEKSARTEEELKLIELTIELSESRADIKVKLPKRPGAWPWSSNVRGGATFKLMVPATAQLERIRTVNSSVEIKGVRGPVDAGTVNGRIRAHGLGAATRLNTVNGGLEASFAALGGGQDVALRTVNGAIRVALPSDAGFELDASVVNGSIACDFPIETKGRVSGKRVNGKVGDARASISAHSVNGGIRLDKR